MSQGEDPENIVEVASELKGSFQDVRFKKNEVRERCNMADKKTRKTRSDCTVGTFEKKHGLPPGTFRNSNGRDTRSDKG